MSRDAETLAVYAAKAGEYAELFARGEPDTDLQAFIKMLPKGAHVLDLGCGPGNTAAILLDAGFSVEARDASPEMVALARSKFGIKARLETFAELSDEEMFDAVWANFSLLHAPKADFPGHLLQIATSLKPGGVFHLGLKLGAGEARDTLGRRYAYYSEKELAGLLEAAGFEVAISRTGSARGLAGSDEPFIIILCRKHSNA